jgi:hypothetical protein
MENGRDGGWGVLKRGVKNDNEKLQNKKNQLNSWFLNYMTNLVTI